MSLPLSGLLVAALEQAVAAPMCTCRLADAGARVIKIERPEGDFARGYDKLAKPRDLVSKQDGRERPSKQEDGRERADALQEDGRERPDALQEDGRERPDGES